MIRKLFAVVTGDGMNREARQQSDHLLSDRFLSSLFHQTHTKIAAFTIHQGNNCAFLAFAYDRIRFPISQPASVICGLWAFINRCSIKYLSPFIVAAIALFTLFLTSEMFPKASTLSLVFIDILVDPFMAYLKQLVVSAMITDLFRASF